MPDEEYDVLGPLSYRLEVPGASAWRDMATADEVAVRQVLGEHTLEIGWHTTCGRHDPRIEAVRWSFRSGRPLGLSVELMDRRTRLVYRIVGAFIVTFVSGDSVAGDLWDIAVAAIQHIPTRDDLFDKASLFAPAPHEFMPIAELLADKVPDFKDLEEQWRMDG